MNNGILLAFLAYAVYSWADAAVKALGLPAILWTVSERAGMEELMALGIDGIITDDPDRLRAVMAEKGMPLPPQAR